ncbi:Hypothetical predicted protein [Mytilus galloprovincialis]|uniref:C-type lectin domain-containing protein n=1 Tax=Mytilus galloprovincialis TaxID=29158 RepID=A0A8B6H2A3_MYTGA|nr:Hypothetical predicted protein [Mytilus galloprovincialis]
MKNCNGRKSCTVAANNRLYGDPCPGTHKYVTVTYYCKVKKTPKCLRRCHRQAKCIRRKCVCKSGYKGDGIRSCTNIKDECSYPYRRVGKGCYLIQKDNVSGDTAFAKCLQRGAYLANFETLNEAMLMKYELLKMKTGVHYYVGGRNINRYKTGGDWRWIKKDGKMVKMKYFAFDNGEPNGTLKASQDCMFFYASRGYRFHAVWCAMGGLLGGYICEK